MSALTDLKSLPDIIRFADIPRILGTTPEGAKLMVHRWKERDLIKPLGPRAGIYFNLVRRPDWEAMMPEAVALAFPSAVVVGLSVLHHHGWTNQIPQHLHIAIPCQRTVPAIDGVIIHQRPRAWYARFRPANQDVLVYGLPALSPPQALLDLQEHPHEGALDPDDLDTFAMEDWESDHGAKPQTKLGLAAQVRSRRPR